MSSKTLQLTCNRDGIAWITLSRHPCNVLSIGYLREIVGVLGEVSQKPSTWFRAAVLCSGLPNVFSAGADVAEHTPERSEAMLEAITETFFSIRKCPFPVVAAVRGKCLGGGLELVLACDLVVADESARFGVPEIRLGVFPPIASCALPGIVGERSASALCLGGREIDASRAREMGVVHYLGAGDSLDRELERTLDGFRSSSPASLRRAKEALRAARRDDELRDRIEQANRYYLDEVASSPEAIEGVRAFLDGRRPDWG